MTRIHLLPRPAPSAVPPPTLAPRGRPSLGSGLILALLALAVVLQASFFVGLARGTAGGPDPDVPARVASAR